ncbi:putative MFS family transporter protein [Microbulbifer aggregans]|uniref:Putative MFS family transporter protein n=1 Tax=Microbulbifer aggregans TaxID=1769779 RepID=A0A1C9W4B6_9GAMM|nr:MFS transporter [Microbulbifer aggregans]AOS95998.1 putative MFS family transporter protein [Microbulbifer aggregans]
MYDQNSFSALPVSAGAHPDRASAVMAAVVVSMIAMGAFLILPLLIGAVAVELSLSESQLGVLSTAAMSGSAISSLLAVVWVRRVNWRLAGYLGISTMLVAHIGSLLVESFALFAVLQFLAGLGAGAVYSVALTALSDNRNADRCFGYSIAAQVTFQVVGMLALSSPVADYGLEPVLLTLVAMDGVALLLLFWLPDQGSQSSQQAVFTVVRNPLVLLTLAGCFLFFLNVGVFWTFIERIGAAAGFDAAHIGISLAVGVSFGVPGALLASWCGARFGRLLPLALGALITVASIVVLVIAMTPTGYLMALALYNFGWNFSLAFQYAAVNAADKSGRGVAVAPAFHGLGAAAGPALAAAFVGNADFRAVYVLSAAGVVASLALFVFASLRQRSTHMSPALCTE